MDLRVHYNSLYKASREKIIAENYEVDELINSSSDNRFGLTLLIRPDDEVKMKIRRFLNALKNIDPFQYYYPPSDIHVTVMSVISCYSGFDPANIALPDYVKLVNKSLHTKQNIEIEFSGITASPSCIMIQGFPRNNVLNDIRDNLRMNFRHADIERTIDKRYKIQTAHATVVRFQNKFSNKQELLRIIEGYRDYYFGTSIIDTVELVSNDWYQRREFVKVLHKFNVGSNLNKTPFHRPA